MAIHPQSDRPHPGGPMSVEEYLQLDRTTLNARYEYIDGVARMRSGGSVAHDRISRNISYSLDMQFLSGPCSVHGSDMQVLVGTKTSGQPHYYYPDVTVSCDVADRRRDNTLIESPMIVVEVLSPGTEATDRHKKLKAYKACPTIHEIVFISQFARYVEVYHHNEEDNTAWSHIIYDDSTSIVILPSLDLEITMDEIYRGINFDEPLLENRVQ
jgi:Uma2 family endonuclease